MKSRLRREEQRHTKALKKIRRDSQIQKHRRRDIDISKIVERETDRTLRQYRLEEEARKRNLIAQEIYRPILKEQAQKAAWSSNVWPDTTPSIPLPQNPHIPPGFASNPELPGFGTPAPKPVPIPYIPTQRDGARVLRDEEIMRGIARSYVERTSGYTISERDLDRLMSYKGKEREQAANQWIKETNRMTGGPVATTTVGPGELMQRDFAERNSRTMDAMSRSLFLASALALPFAAAGAATVSAVAPMEMEMAFMDSEELEAFQLTGKIKIL